MPGDAEIARDHDAARRGPITDRPVRVVCFGEMLWDGLPTGRVPGGAPFNVAYHLHRLGCAVQMVSAVGRDPLGDELLAYATSRGLSTALVQRHATLPTGLVEVQYDANLQPSYLIRPDVAWDAIALNDEILAAVQEADALIFGTLATRSAVSRQTLEALLAVPRPCRYIDVNLRAPHDDREWALALARRADWIKLNEAELALLTGKAREPENLPEAIEKLIELTGIRRLCVTRGEKGAMLWQQSAILSDHVEPVRGGDPVGAGDAFMAALVHGTLTLPIRESPQILRRALDLGRLVASLPGAQPEYRPLW